jgi:subtilisin family serine protease
MAAKGGKPEGIQRELDDLRSRITSLEQDNEMLMDLARNISKIFAANNAPADDDKMAYKKGVSKTLNIIIRNVGKGALITAAHYSALEKYSDLATYADADWFRKQLIVAFENIYFHVNKENVWELSFDEVKGYLQDISKFEDKAEFHVYVKNLKGRA